VQIKELTNNTELINTISKLGHGVSYSVLEELLTEVAYKNVEKRRENEETLPDKIEEGLFTMIVEDNIDRLEETLSGTKDRINKFPSFK